MVGARASVGALVVMAALVVVGAAGSRARAQGSEPEARALFERGSAAVRAGRLADARRDLERSLALVPRASTGFNLVVALRGMGELVSANDVCERLLGGELGALEDAQRAQATSVCADTREGIATLRVRAAGAAPFELRVDGLSLGMLAPGDELDQALDPGAHVVTVVAEGGTPVDRALDAGRGERLELALEAPSVARDGGADVGWIVAGSLAGAAVVAAVVIGIVVATGAGPREDYPIVETLRF